MKENSENSIRLFEYKNNSRMYLVSNLDHLLISKLI